MPGVTGGDHVRLPVRPGPAGAVHAEPGDEMTREELGRRFAPAAGRLKLLVHAPPFRWTSGGCVVLHSLCRRLRRVGADAYLWAGGEPAANPDWDTPFANGKIDPTTPDVVAVYPEVVTGNPLGTRHVVRWLLNVPGLLGGDGVYPAADLIYTYAPRFGSGPPLTVIELRRDLFHPPPPGSSRSGGCYVVRKGSRTPRVAATEGMEHLPDDTTHEVYADRFRRCETFYSYDPTTTLSVLAALCGCRSVVVPEPGVSGDRWRAGLPSYFGAGIAYGAGEIERAEHTRPELSTRLQTVQSETDSQIESLLAAAGNLVRGNQ